MGNIKQKEGATIKKPKKSFISTAIVTTLASSVTPIAFAHDVSPINNQEIQETEKLSEKYFMNNSTLFNQYMELDSNKKEYHLTNNAKDVLDYQTNFKGT
ncbi:hypothetical protein ACQKKK_11650 [Peribacillus sp. NPDC006672]|uniref:hypothetical protein n=1 Tax=Peribacillus sp. NPDC006672 TaxID=3390606 RepID=UPI003CFD97D5